MRPWRAESTEGRKGAPSERLLAVLNALQTGGKRKHGTNVTSSSIRTGSIRALLKYTRNIEHMNVIISSTHPHIIRCRRGYFSPCGLPFLPL